jgi:hypothetical protein
VKDWLTVGLALDVLTERTVGFRVSILSFR